jgi:hypothetical protein
MPDLLRRLGVVEGGETMAKRKSLDALIADYMVTIETEVQDAIRKVNVDYRKGLEDVCIRLLSDYFFMDQAKVREAWDKVGANK